MIHWALITNSQVWISYIARTFITYKTAKLTCKMKPILQTCSFGRFDNERWAVKEEAGTNCIERDVLTSTHSNSYWGKHQYNTYQSACIPCCDKSCKSHNVIWKIWILLLPQCKMMVWKLINKFRQKWFQRV